MKNQAAVAMGKRRWEKVSKADKTAHALKMLAARKDRQKGRKAE